ncbi:thiosulfate dehydrogenase [Sphingobium yanoikuyae]|uniref:Transcriptional initiation protein Tat n=1 Tax=Sphingobium yanoikuyae TaxID=13690 RepID=A0A291MYL4_SPHYA|nr:transcriptional initiation protein Tat [Sphingobium yanoikuyae]ATI80025.1 transcriptional initiation protein Tat [Sphingobium yanoikuyae]
MIDQPLNRRRAFAMLGGAAALLAVPGAVFAQAGGNGASSALPSGSGALAELSRRLRAAPRRRSFDTVPFMIDRRELWDHEASDLLLSYRGDRKQMWESSDINAPWLNLMREAVNGQVFAHGHPDFLPVAAVHGTAHLALFNQAMWERYGLAANAGGQISRNVFVAGRAGTSPADDRQKVDGFYGAGNNNIASLQRRGAVMVACHDSIHAIARGIVSKAGAGSPDQIAADLTNNLIDDVVLVPSVVAYIVELQEAGFTYAKAS